MSLPLKDVHIRLTTERHGAAVVFAEIDGADSLVEWCREIVCREIDRRVHEATVVATRLHGLGLCGSERD